MRLQRRGSYGQACLWTATPPRPLDCFSTIAGAGRQQAATLVETAQAAGQIDNNQVRVDIDGGAGNDLIFGTRTGTNYIHGGTGNDEVAAGGYASEVYGDEGNDRVRAGLSFESHLYGGKDKTTADTDTDLFYLATGAFAKAGTQDYALWGSSLLTGGVKQIWMEGKWAYWSPITSLFNINPFAFLSPLGVTGIVLDFAQQLVRYSVGTGGQLVAQFARGNAGQAVIEDFQNVNANGESSAHIAVLKQGGKATSVDQVKDSVDLALQAGFGTCIRGTDPLILDLDGDGVELIRQDAASIYFNLDGDANAERTAWVKGDDGFLVRDLNANGKIDDITEMFGNATTPGFTALKTLDTNNDNKITSADTGFATLRVRKDLNSNGVTDAGELFTLASLGITEISAVGTPQTDKWNNGSAIRAEATFVAGGVTRTISDVLLETSQTDTKYTGTTVISTAAAALPALKGYGDLVDLRLQMTVDAVATVGLLAKVTAMRIRPHQHRYGLSDGRHEPFRQVRAAAQFVGGEVERGGRRRLCGIGHGVACGGEESVA